MKTYQNALIALTLTSLAWVAVAEAGPRDRGGRGLLPPSGYLELTEEQIDAAQAIREQTRDSIEPIRDEMRALRGQLKANFESGDPDATEVGQLMIDIHAQRQQLRTLREDAEGQFAALLTAEQLEKWENFKELRRGRGGRRAGPGDDGLAFGRRFGGPGQ
ncbi:MAG: Spy/CpxP family protein refolding chaperone [Acidobacteriota bacterium]